MMTLSSVTRLDCALTRHADWGTIMQIIGAGLPRTATLTQKIALEMLGFGPCYHMVNVLSDSSRIPGWADALDGRAEWDKIFDGFSSTVDYPAAFYVSELVDA